MPKFVRTTLDGLCHSVLMQVGGPMLVCLVYETVRTLRHPLEVCEQFLSCVSGEKP
jgi:hypothetical protein